MLKGRIGRRAWLQVAITTVVVMTDVGRVQAQRGFDLVRAPDAEPHDWFGRSLAVSEHTLIVGSPRDDSPGQPDTGSAHLYRWESSAWRHEAKLVVARGFENDAFGTSVDVDGEVAVVGAHNQWPSGAAYVYRFDGQEWRQEAVLTPSDASAQARFGNSVSIDGNVIVVGAPKDDAVKKESGSAFVFRRSRDNWSEEQKLTEASSGADDSFGKAVSINDETLVVGAPGHDERGENSGAAYLYHYDGGKWGMEITLTAENEAFGSLGTAVAIDGDVVIVGAIGHDGSGAGYIYRYRDGIGWAEEDEIVPLNGADGDRFGRSVAISGSHLVIGADQDDECGIGTGSAYVYRHVDGEWTEVSKLLPPGAHFLSNAGSSVAIDGDVVAVGALRADGPGEDPFEDSGAAFVYRGFDFNESGFCAPAQALMFTDFAKWSSANDTFDTIGFCEFVPNTFITDQYEDLGVTFVGDPDIIRHGCTWCTNDGCGLDGNLYVELEFASPQRWIAVHQPGTVQLSLFGDDTLLFTSQDSNDLFVGLVSLQPFDRVLITCPDEDGEIAIDDLHFGAAIPGDVNFDGTVNVSDVIEVIFAWGLCVGPPPTICFSDFDADGTVDRVDLLNVLANWSVEFLEELGAW